MNCTECKELLVAYFEGLLDDVPARTVEEHLRSCDACPAELKELQTLRRRLVHGARATAETDLEERVMNRILQEQSERLKSAQRATAGLRIRRLIMKSSLVKIAMAAALVAIALGAWSLWSGTQPGVALADVLVRVQQVQAFAYKMTMRVKGPMQGSTATETDMTGSVLIANEHGTRMDMSMMMSPTGQTMQQQMYILPGRKMMMMVLPAEKTYMRMELDESMFEKLQKQNNDPRLTIKQILECKYRDLGKSVIDGIQVQGFQTTDPAYGGNVLGDVDVRIWVDAKTGFPIRMDMKIRAGQQMEMEGTMYDFQWDVPVAAEEFDPVLPADYKAGPGDGFKIPAMTEDTAVAGLKLCADLLGKYPEDLNMLTLMQTAVKGLKDSQTPEAQRLRSLMEQARDDEERARLLVEPVMPIQMLGGFYGTLTQEQKEPAYHGKVVTPGDKALVLMRWKTGEDEYRVLFGDLHAETVDAETLAKLEAALPK